MGHGDGRAGEGGGWRGEWGGGPLGWRLDDWVRLKCPLLSDSDKYILWLRVYISKWESVQCMHWGCVSAFPLWMRLYVPFAVCVRVCVCVCVCVTVKPHYQAEAGPPPRQTDEP